MLTSHESHFTHPGQILGTGCVRHACSKRLFEHRRVSVGFPWSIKQLDPTTWASWYTLVCEVPVDAEINNL